MLRLVYDKRFVIWVECRILKWFYCFIIHSLFKLVIWGKIYANKRWPSAAGSRMNAFQSSLVSWCQFFEIILACHCGPLTWVLLLFILYPIVNYSWIYHYTSKHWSSASFLPVFDPANKFVLRADLPGQSLDFALYTLFQRVGQKLVFQYFRL